MQRLEVDNSEVNHWRKQALRGNYADNFCKWRTPYWKLLVFVSSTFTDTHTERDELVKILKSLSNKAVKCSINVIFSDMRWGIPGKAALEHGTWLSCSRELERCRDQSSGIYFLSLQSEKYIEIIHFMFNILIIND